MTYFCYIHTRDSDIPHWEVAPDGDLAKARAHALKCLGERQHPVAARIYEDEQLVETICVDPASRWVG